MKTKTRNPTDENPDRVQVEERTQDGGQRIEMETMGLIFPSVLNGGEGDQVTILRNYIKANNQRKRKVNCLLGIAVTFLTITMMLSVFIITKHFCSDINNDPGTRETMRRDQVAKTGPETPTAWGKLLHHLYLKEQGFPSNKAQDDQDEDEDAGEAQNTHDQDPKIQQDSQSKDTQALQFLQQAQEQTLQDTQAFQDHLQPQEQKPKNKTQDPTLWLMWE